MTESEVVYNIAQGAHPGNFFDNVPRVYDYSEETERTFLKHVPADWYAAQRLIIMWFFCKRHGRI